MPEIETIYNDRWISLQEVFDYLCVKPTVMRWIEQCNMPASKTGKLWRFKTSDIDEWVRNGRTTDDQEFTQ